MWGRTDDGSKNSKNRSSSLREKRKLSFSDQRESERSHHRTISLSLSLSLSLFLSPRVCAHTCACALVAAGPFGLPLSEKRELCCCKIDEDSLFLAGVVVVAVDDDDDVCAAAPWVVMALAELFLSLLVGCGGGLLSSGSP